MRILLKITDYIDVAMLQQIQDTFSDATGLAAITVDYKGNPITEYSNFNPYCTAMREVDEFRDYCYLSDAHGGLMSARSGKPSIFICHGGLVDLAVPIMVKGNYLGAIMAGQIIIPDEEMAKLPYGSETLTNIEAHPGLCALREHAKHSTLDKVEAAANLLFTIANYLVEREMVHVMQKELHNANLELMEEVKLRSEAEAALKEADLKALRAQINPHFLFNVLNTIGRLAMLENADKTQDMVFAFSDMMRYTLKKENNDFVTLKEEVDHVKNYLSIQKVRLGERLTYDIDISPRLGNVLCPFMTIQPFVENAINHAIEPNSAGGRIVIRAVRKGDDVIITITDNGPGIPPALIDVLLDDTEANDSATSTGIGIQNANKRLKYYYGPTYGIRYNKAISKGTEVILRIPYKTVPGGK